MRGPRPVFVRFSRPPFSTRGPPLAIGVQVHALISGPSDTPYEGGFFYFLLKVPPDYPSSPPLCRIMTTEQVRHGTCLAGTRGTGSAFSCIASDTAPHVF